jgi:2,3-bisphosphoglycerate-dependent phosphoglycerate mutase
MKTLNFILIAALFITSGCSGDDNANFSIPTEEAKTVIYLIRHAEKADQSADPNLSEAGMLRAQNWAVILQDIPFAACYSTPYNRTQQTIEPTAANNQQEVILYNPDDFSLADVIENHYAKNVLIVGHSNTIPELINQFLGEEIYPTIDELQFGNLYKITIQGETVSHELAVYN